jgi:general stress protein YciG
MNAADEKADEQAGSKPDSEPKPKPKRPRGFAAMSPEKQHEIASKGGRNAQAKGTAHKFTQEEAREAGFKGGRATAEIKKRRYSPLPPKPPKPPKQRKKPE